MNPLKVVYNSYSCFYIAFARDSGDPQERIARQS